MVHVFAIFTIDCDVTVHFSLIMTGATKMNQLEEAAKAMSIKLTDDEMKKLEELYKPHPVLGHDQPTTALAGHKL